MHPWPPLLMTYSGPIVGHGGALAAPGSVRGEPWGGFDRSVVVGGYHRSKDVVCYYENESTEQKEKEGQHVRQGATVVVIISR